MSLNDWATPFSSTVALVSASDTHDDATMFMLQQRTNTMITGTPPLSQSANRQLNVKNCCKYQK